MSDSIVALNNRARLLKRAVDKGDPLAVARVSRVLGEAPASFGLGKAQKVVALESGFSSWDDAVKTLGVEND